MKAEILTVDSEKINAIDIQDGNDCVIGVLKPITKQLVTTDIAKSLSKWRNANKECFLTQFEATADRTYSWLNNHVINPDNKLLFLITEQSGKPIGNIGLINITPESVELDNVLKGEAAEIQGFMLFSAKTLIKWCRNVLGAKMIYLHVLSDNDRALNFYKKLGFYVSDKISLKEISNEDYEKILELDRNSNELSSLHLIKMECAMNAEDNVKIKEFRQEVKNNIDAIGKDTDLRARSMKWVDDTARYNYSYNFNYLGRPIIQYPQDIVAMQEIIWEVKPDLIIETGIAHGGSLIFSASMLALIEYSEAVTEGKSLDVTKPRTRVLGIDIDIRDHNRAAIEQHPMSNRIDMIQGSSIASETIAKVKEYAKDYKNILVCLDSNHTEEHVLAELNAYADFVAKGSYCVVFDTVVEDLPDDLYPNRPWGQGDNPKTAVWKYVEKHPEFSVDKSIDNKLLISVAPDGYLKRER